MLNVNDSLKFLKSKGLPVVKQELIKDNKSLIKAVNKLGYPLVAKINSSSHKTDIGGVKLNINSMNELREFLKKNKEIIIQHQEKGIELIIGIKKDRSFGQVIMTGLGGVFVELFKDVSFKVCPVTKREAREMIRELKAYKLLKGYRGSEEVNLNKLTDLITTLSRIAVKEDIKELDINPLIISRNHLSIVDARLEL